MHQDSNQGATGPLDPMGSRIHFIRDWKQKSNFLPEWKCLLYHDNHKNYSEVEDFLESSPQHGACFSGCTIYNPHSWSHRNWRASWILSYTNQKSSHPSLLDKSISKYVMKVIVTLQKMNSKNLHMRKEKTKVIQVEKKHNV